MIIKGKDTDKSFMGNSSNMRRIRRLTEREELLMMREITCDDKNHRKTKNEYFRFFLSRLMRLYLLTKLECEEVKKQLK